MFEKYASYSSEDFVQDEYFVGWVQSPGPQSNQFWNDFQETFPYQRPVVRRAIQVVQNLATASQTIVPQGDAEEIWVNLQNSIASGKKYLKWWQRPWTKVAAAAFVAIGAGYLFFVSENSSSAGSSPAMSFFASDSLHIASGPEINEFTNTTPVPDVIILPDSSRVTLQPNGTIRYNNKTFSGATRNVQLVGEAFFEVTRDTERPFLVYSNGLITKVLGTSFNIKARKGSDNVTVMVRTGKVSVFTLPKNPKEDPESHGLILRANQQVDYSKKIEKLTRTLVPEPVPVLSTEEMQQFAFQNAPVTDIFKALEKVYDTEILFDQELLSDCRLTSTLDEDVSLFEKLDVLCEAIDASYKVVDAQVVISGRKCR